MPMWCMPLRLAACCALLLLVAGCGKPASTMLPIYPVMGTVHYKGGLPVAGGAIQFVSLSDSSYSVSGEINEDGTFTLYTVKGSERVQGAPEGAYRVSVQPPIPSDHRAVPAISLPDTYRIEPKENTFTVEVNAPGKK
jgi:hypothetical protein